MDPFTLDCSALPDRPRVLAFRGEEELGRCFEYDVLFTLDDDAALGLDAAGVLGAAARLVLGDGLHRLVHRFRLGGSPEAMAQPPAHGKPVGVAARGGVDAAARAT